MRQAKASEPWFLFLAIFIFSAPVIVLGSLTDIRLLPGLPVSALMVVTIGAAASLFAYRSGGRAAVLALIARVVDFGRTAPPAWHLLSVLLMPGALLVEYWIMKAASLPLPTPQIAWLEALPLLAVFFVTGALEEIAWTGSALEPLQKRHGALRAALIIGTVWAVLHAVPYAQVQSLMWVVGQCVFSVSFRVVLVWLYNVTGRSVFATVLCHASYNTAWQLFPNHGSAYDPWLAAAMTAAIAAVVTLASGSRMAAAGQALERPTDTS